MAIGNSINSGGILTLGGNLTTVGAFNSTFTMTGGTSVTFPTSGTLSTTSQLYTVSEVTAATQTIAVNHGYVANRGTLITFTLPSTAALGDEFDISGLGAGGWIIAQNANQLIHVGSAVSTTGVGGSVASANRYDTIRLRCVVANLEFTMLFGVSAGFTIV